VRLVGNPTLESNDRQRRDVPSAAAGAELWRTTVTQMNNVKIVAASLRVTLSQVQACFGDLIEKTRSFLFSISVSEQNKT
jgi:hypothetical protein